MTLVDGRVARDEAIDRSANTSAGQGLSEKRDVSEGGDVSAGENTSAGQDVSERAPQDAKDESEDPTPS